MASGGAFGGRRYDGLVFHVTLGFAAFARAALDWVARRPRVAAGVALAVLVGWGLTCNGLMAEDFRQGRLPPAQAKDTFAWYQRVFGQFGRWLWRAGNPVSWPGAWGFALRTGAPPARYDEVVGVYFLVDSELEAFRRRQDKLVDELRFGDAAHQKFLVSGFAPGGGVASTARVLVPLNLAHGVELHLVGSADASAAIWLVWNGREIARGAVPAGPFDLPATLPAQQVGRGMNVLDVGVTVPVRLDKLTLRQLP